MSQFPILRMRRLRTNPELRSLAQETRLSVDNLVYPIFVIEGTHLRQEITAMPARYRLSPDELPGEVEHLTSLGLKAVLLFGVPDFKDEQGSGAYDPNGVVQRSIKVIKQTNSNMLVITDVCLCEYTSHGHCGMICNGQVDNDATLPIIGQVAVSHAQAGADMVAPSGMMDGQVSVIRKALDEAGFNGIPIMAYSAKYASSFYGPFREAAGSTPQFGDRRTYQMNPPNAREAMREIAQDIAEGADIVMVKPALAYLDIIRMARDQFDYPIAAYNVSGEYSMVKITSERGLINERQMVIEILTAIKRAGADIIITYHAPEVAEWLRA